MLAVKDVLRGAPESIAFPRAAVSILQRGFLCFTDGVCGVENALQQSQLPLAGEVRDKTLPAVGIEPGSL